jgi:hypothetical protein
VIEAVQDIVAKCQRSLSTFSHVGGPAISALWKDALDSGTKQSKGEVQSEMLRAAFNNEYWDIAQQVRIEIITFAPKTRATFFFPPQNTDQVSNINSLCYYFTSGFIAHS